MKRREAIYNEIDEYAAQWLRNLVAAGHIAPGDVNGRSIKELTAADVAGPGQRHFFAGIGVWSYALRLAGWPDGASVWTGSCPCQPFSVAGAGEGFDDERHLWPDWFKLIEADRPVCVLGEQVASPGGLAWLDTVFTDMEGAGYACWAVDFCAAGIGAPHIRQRLYWCAVDLSRLDELFGVADATGERFDGRGAGEASDGRDAARVEPERLRDARGVADDGGRRQIGAHAGGSGEGGTAQGVGQRLVHGGALGVGGLADDDLDRRKGLTPPRAGAGESLGNDADRRGASGGLGSPSQQGLEGFAGHGDDGDEPRRVDALAAGSTPAAGPVNGFWSDAEWLPCRDGKWRPVRPGSFPLVDGAPARVGRLRAYGNALVAQEAAAFARVVLESLLEWRTAR